MGEIQHPQTVDRQEKVSIQDHKGYERQTQIVENLNAERRAGVSRLAQLIWLLFGVLEGLIGLRVLLKLLAANPENPFARLIYSVTDIFLWPFSGSTITPSFGDIVFEVPAIIAIFVYALAGWILVRLVWLIFYRPTTRTVRTIERESDSYVE